MGTQGFVDGVLLVFGAAALGANTALFVRAFWRPGSAYISPIPLVGGLAAAVGATFATRTGRGWWIPLVIDPAGLVPLAISAWRNVGSGSAR